MPDNRGASFDLHSPRASAADAISIDSDDAFDARPGWGEILVTAAMTAAALLLVSFFAILIGMA